MKVGKFAIKNFRLLTDAYRDAVVSRPRVFEWNRWFREGCDDVENEKHFICQRLTITFQKQSISCKKSMTDHSNSMAETVI